MGKVYATMLTVWCLWSVVHAQGTGVLAGRVLDAQGKPVSGATDENGRITLDVAAGSVTLMPGFSPFSPTLVPPGFFARVQVKDLKTVGWWTLQTNRSSAQRSPCCLVGRRCIKSPTEAPRRHGWSSLPRCPPAPIREAGSR